MPAQPDPATCAIVNKSEAAIARRKAVTPPLKPEIKQHQYRHEN
jgi:hypothetical protein